MPSVVNLFKLATILGVPAEDLYLEIKTTAAHEVKEKQTPLKNENEWIRRMKLRHTARSPQAAEPIKKIEP